MAHSSSNQWQSSNHWEWTAENGWQWQGQQWSWSARDHEQKWWQGQQWSSTDSAAATTPTVAGAADPPIEEEVEEDEPDPRYHKDNIQAHLGETFVGFEFERPVLPEGYIWAPGNKQGHYILIKEEITAELYGDRQQGTHATTPAVAGAADPPTEEDVEEDEPDPRYYKDNIQVPWKT